MKLMWNESLKINTIHVDDVVAAAFYLAQTQQANRQCYNLVDDSQSTQGSISNVLANIFNIKIDYWGEGLSNLSKVCMHKRIVHHFALMETNSFGRNKNVFGFFFDSVKNPNFDDR